MLFRRTALHVLREAIQGNDADPKQAISLIYSSVQLFIGATFAENYAGLTRDDKHLLRRAKTASELCLTNVKISDVNSIFLELSIPTDSCSESKSGSDVLGDGSVENLASDGQHAADGVDSAKEASTGDAKADKQ